MTFQCALPAVLASALAAVVAAPAQAGNEAAAEVTYYQDVLPIMQENCQTCHRPVGLNIGGLSAPMSFTSYAETRPWARAIAGKVEAREMPPWFASATHRRFLQRARPERRRNRHHPALGRGRRARRRRRRRAAAEAVG